MSETSARRTILIIATLDTKSLEIIYLKQRIEEQGLKTLVLDTGILGTPQNIVPDISAQETAEAAGSTLEEIKVRGERGHSVEKMLEGTRAITERLYKEGRIQGVISMGGAGGAVMAASAMQVLPPGFPKVIISPVASGVRPFGPLIGIRDITVMHSLIDIAGINEISKAIFNNAAAAISGMVKSYQPMQVTQKNLVAITTLGTTDVALKMLLPRLEKAGFTPVMFHATGVGGRVMEDMIERGFFCGVIDLCTNELTDHLVGAFHDAGPTRLEAAGKIGIPQVVVPGCMDFFCQGAPNTIPDKWKNRKHYYHNPSFTLIRPTHEETKKLGEMFAAKVNKAVGPVTVVIPLNGLSIGGLKGGSTYDPEGDAILFKAIKSALRSDIRVIEVDRHINEEPFVETLAREFCMLNEGRTQDEARL